MPECLIIGGGVVGLSLAYELSRTAPSWRIRVVDRQETGREASWAGAGILPPANRHAAVHPLDQLRGLACELHRDWARRLVDETGIDTGYRQCGGLYLATTPGEAASLFGLAALLDEEQVSCQRLTRDQLAELEPALGEVARSGRVAVALRLPDEAQLRNPRHMRALRSACERRGVSFVVDSAVDRLDVTGDRVTAVHARCGSFSADRVCVTAGAWSSRLLESIGLSIGVVPIRGQMRLYRSERPLLRHVVNEGPRYLVPRDDGRLLAGSTEEEAGFDKRTTAEGLAGLHEFACRLVPALRETLVENSWAGLRPGSYDGQPYIGAAPGFENLFVASGHFRSGLYLSPATAVVMAALIQGQPPPVDIGPFRISRG